MSLLPKIPGSVLGVLFPAFCLHCNRELEFGSWTGICPRCWAQLEPWAGPMCYRCGLPSSPQSIPRPSGLCDSCHQDTYTFDFARSLTIYSGAARTLIHQLKFNRRERLAPKLGEALAASAAHGPLRQLLRFACQPGAGGPGNQALENPLVLVPVPLHPAREKERGFNQAERIARGLVIKVERLDPAVRWEVDPRGLKRIRPTAPQSGLDFRARQENVRNSFRAASQDRFKNRIVVLVDDVMTTGATASACARELKKAGAQRVMVLTVARAAPWLDGIPEAARPAVDVEGA
ncbi:MAG: ComF family protein [Terriglobia bacterium]